MLATVYDENWFLVANDVAELKVILDRVDGRLKDRAATLAGDSTFSAAFKHMPASYSSLIYGRVDRYLEKMAPLLGGKWGERTRKHSDLSTNSCFLRRADFR